MGLTAWGPSGTHWNRLCARNRFGSWMMTCSIYVAARMAYRHRLNHCPIDVLHSGSYAVLRPVNFDLFQVEVLFVEQLNTDVTSVHLPFRNPNERACPRKSSQQGVCVFAKHCRPRLVIIGNLNFQPARAGEKAWIGADAIVDPYFADLPDFIPIDAPPRGEVESRVAVVRPSEMTAHDPGCFGFWRSFQ